MINYADNLVSIQDRVKDKIKHELGDLINADTILLTMYERKIDELCKRSKSLCIQAKNNRRFIAEYAEKSDNLWVKIDNDLADLLRISKATIWSWCTTGQIISRKIGGSREVLFEDLQKRVEILKGSKHWLRGNRKARKSL